MLKEKSISVSQAKLIKSGTTNGKNWSIFQIIDQDGWKLSTFEKTLAQLGISARVWFDEEDKTFPEKKNGVETGKQISYKQRTIRKFEIGAEYQSQGQTPEPSKLVKAMVTAEFEERLRALEARVEQLESPEYPL